MASGRAEDDAMIAKAKASYMKKTAEKMLGDLIKRLKRLAELKDQEEVEKTMVLVNAQKTKIMFAESIVGRIETAMANKEFHVLLQTLQSLQSVTSNYEDALAKLSQLETTTKSNIQVDNALHKDMEKHLSREQRDAYAAHLASKTPKDAPEQE